MSKEQIGWAPIPFCEPVRPCPFCGIEPRMEFDEAFRAVEVCECPRIQGPPLFKTTNEDNDQ